MLLAIALLAASAAQPGTTVSPFFADPTVSAALGSIDPKPGAWAEYLIRASGKGDLRVRATALPAAGEGRYWLELATASETGIASAARLLLHGTDFSAGGVERAILMLAGQQPIEVPPEYVGRGEARSAANAQVKKLGTERVRVPAGEISAERLRVSGVRVWRSASVPLWGLVKAVSPRESIELVASGITGGHSVFPPGWDQGNGSESRK